MFAPKYAQNNNPYLFYSFNCVCFFFFFHPENIFVVVFILSFILSPFIIILIFYQLNHLNVVISKPVEFLIKSWT